MTNDWRSAFFILPSIRVAPLLAYSVLYRFLSWAVFSFLHVECAGICSWFEAITGRVISSMVIILALKSIAIPNYLHGVAPRTRSYSGLISLCSRPHQVLTRTLSYQRHCRTRPHPALERTFCYQHPLEVQLSLGLTPLGDPIRSIPWLWNQPFWVGTHHGLSLVKKD